MRKTTLPTNYRIYLLSTWMERGEDASKSGQRFRLEDPRTGERLGFHSPHALLNYFQASNDENTEE